MQATYTTWKPRFLALAGVLSLLLSTGAAQTTVPASDSPATESDADQTITLSPFTVDSSQDQGYRATSTLAGSRINTKLKDVAAPITVVTKEFINDLAAVGVNDVLSYTANTEGTRDFTQAPLSLGRPSDNISQNPNTANRIRGLASADITRDYFYTIGTWVGFDTYNLDQVTINRGPNSILAGLGSPAGIIDYSPQLAGLTRDKYEISYRFGSFGDKRATANANVVALKDVLAFRVAGSWSDVGFEQQPAYRRDERLFLTSAFKPWKKTTIRASFETVKIKANDPNNLTPEDDVSQWIAAGKPVNTGTAPVSPLLTKNGANEPILIFNQSGKLESSYNVNGLYDFFQLIPNGYTPYRMNNNNYFQLNKVNLEPSLESPLRYKSFNVSLDQEIVKDLNANIAFVHETVDNNFLDLFRSDGEVYSVDVNQLLPNGATNPHFGQTFMEFGGLDNKQVDHNTNQVVRGTLTYDLHLDTLINKWFGHYRLTGFVEDRKTETEHWQYNALDAQDSSVENIGYRYYLAASPTAAPTAVPRQNGLFTGVTNLFLNPATGTYVTGPMDTVYGLKSDQKQLVKLRTEAFVAQGYLWDDRIVPMIGIRRDKNEASFASAVGGNGNTVNPAGPYGDANIVSQTTKTYGGVVHILKWLSVHYNHSENFIPNAGSVDLLGKPTPSPTGVSKDYGISINTLDDRLNIKLNWFNITAAGASADNANFPLAQWTVPYMELTFMPDLARQAGIVYKPLIAPGLIVGDPRLQNAYTSDNVSKGLELEVTYNVTKNWRVMASLSKQEAQQTNIASGLTAFIQNRLAYWQSIPALWTGFVGQNVGWGVGRTGQQQWLNDNNPYYIAYKSVDGQPSPQLAKWHASGLTNYTIGDGKLKGFSFGAGARYIDKAIIGNPNIYDSTGTAIALDLSHPYYSSAYVAVDAWLGYKMKIFADKYTLSFQLNGRDLQEDGGFRPILANPDGTHAVYRIVQPRTYYFTTTLDF